MERLKKPTQPSTSMILITGGAGFIGSHLCEALVSDNEIICIDNFDNYYSQEIKKQNISSLLHNKRFKFYEADIRNFNIIKQILTKNNITTIIHLAAKVGVRNSIINPTEYIDVNIKGTLNMLRLSKEFGIKKFILASSSSVYGLTSAPFSEDDKADKQISPYGITKRCSELLCYTYHNLYNINTICLRFFTVYGPRGRPDMAPYKFTKAILNNKAITMYGNGSSKRDYTYISDLITGITSALNTDLDFEIINLGYGEPVELKKLISLISKYCGKEPIIKQEPLPLGDIPITWADITKAKKLLNYKPKVNIEEGIKRFITWYIKN